MTDKLPPNLLALFAPRPPLRWVQPSDYPAEQRKTANISGVADLIPALAAYDYEFDYKPTESWLEARDRKKLEKKEDAEKLITEGPKSYQPSDDPNIRGDAFKTLIVARLSYEATEQDLEREFGRFGTIERIRIITDTHAHEKGNKKKKPHRGYAFVVFEREKDMRGLYVFGIMALKLAYPTRLVSPLPSPSSFFTIKAALDGCDGIRIKDRRIKVDVERGRTVKGWKPRRLGGGLGGRGYTKAMPSRPMGPGGFGNGFRGGFNGGFRGRERGFRGGGGGGGNMGDRGFRGGGFGNRGGDRNFNGDRGFGGDRNFGGNDRNFSGSQNGGYSAPSNAPNGPGSGGGFGGRDGNRRDFSGSGGGGYDREGGGRSYNDRSGGGGGYRDRNPRQSGSNMEPIRPRENGGYQGSRDYDRSRDHDDSRKRQYDGGYEDPRKLRRY